jgi:hypothetical protein
MALRLANCFAVVIWLFAAELPGATWRAQTAETMKVSGFRTRNAPVWQHHRSKQAKGKIKSSAGVPSLEKVLQQRTACACDKLIDWPRHQDQLRQTRSRLDFAAHAGRAEAS